MDLLRLLDSTDGRLDTFEGEFCDWLQPSPSHHLILDADDDGPARLRWSGVGPFPAASMAYRRIWVGGMTRIRVELIHAGKLDRFGVRDGSRWWRWDRLRGVDYGSVVTEDGAWTLPRMLDPPLLSPARLIGWLRLGAPSIGVRLDRKVFVARGTPRKAPPGSGLSVELEFDAEHGTILRRAIYDNLNCVQLTEARSVSFGCSVDPERFSFEPPGRPISTRRPAGPRPTAR